MATTTEIEGWAENVNNLNNQELKQLNNYLVGGISKSELGASMDVQTLASNINGLVGVDRTTFEAKLNAVSGGEKKSHFPC